MAERELVKVRAVIGVIERDGWVLVRQRGGHRQFARNEARRGHDCRQPTFGIQKLQASAAAT